MCPLVEREGKYVGNDLHGSMRTNVGTHREKMENDSEESQLNSGWVSKEQFCEVGKRLKFAVVPCLRKLRVFSLYLHMSFLQSFLF